MSYTRTLQSPGVFGASSSRLLLVAGAIVVVMNMLDAIFTILYTRTGAATEANPLMGQMLSASPVLFMIAKLGLVSLGVLLLWRLRHRRTARFGLLATSSAYTMLIFYHLSAVDRLALG
jgi:hypothetical protein